MYQQVCLHLLCTSLSGAVTNGCWRPVSQPECCMRVNIDRLYTRGASLGGISRPLASPSIMNESDQKFAQFSVLLTEAFQHTICVVRGQGRPWNILNVSNCWLLSIELNGGNSRLYISTIQRKCESQHCDGETNRQASHSRRLHSSFVLECRIKHQFFSQIANWRFAMAACKCLGK